MTIYALLDYDGYICKAYYAGYKENKQNKILKDLEKSAIERTAKYFDVPEKEVKIKKVISGHSFKKDLYPSYKLPRKKDEGLGKFRDEVKQSDKTLLCVQSLEADDVITLLQKYINTSGDKCIVFSDDKDLHYFNLRYCKLNTDQEVVENSIPDLVKCYAQMIAGDSEDNVKGVPGMGMKKAIKYIEENLSEKDTIYQVIECYKNKGIDIDECLKNILLILPIGILYIDDISKPLILSAGLMAKEIDMDVVNKYVNETIISQLKMLSALVKGVYAKE